MFATLQTSTNLCLYISTNITPGWSLRETQPFCNRFWNFETRATVNFVTPGSIIFERLKGHRKIKYGQEILVDQDYTTKYELTRLNVTPFNKGHLIPVSWQWSPYFIKNNTIAMIPNAGYRNSVNIAKICIKFMSRFWMWNSVSHRNDITNLHVLSSVKVEHKVGGYNVDAIYEEDHLIV